MLHLVEIPLIFPTGVHMNQSMGSVFHGALMEGIASEAAAQFHQQTMRPYSQCLYWNKETEQAVWRIGTLNDYAYEQIIIPLQKAQALRLRSKGYAVQLGKMQSLRSVSPDELASQFIEAPKAPSAITWESLSVISFKSHGKYIIWPDCRFLYQSLQNRWNFFNQEMHFEDAHFLDALSDASLLTKYRLQSKIFFLEKTAVPGCVGSIQCRLHGFDMLKRIAGLMASFAEFSGIGIKTALGMGAVRTEII